MATASLVKPNIFVVADRLPQLDWVRLRLGLIHSAGPLNVQFLKLLTPRCCPIFL
jgi:hypothetical protein